MQHIIWDLTANILWEMYLIQKTMSFVKGSWREGTLSLMHKQRKVQKGLEDNPGHNPACIKGTFIYFRVHLDASAMQAGSGWPWGGLAKWKNTKSRCFLWLQGALKGRSEALLCFNLICIMLYARHFHKYYFILLVQMNFWGKYYWSSF